VNLAGSPIGQAANVLRTECADLIKAAGVLRQVAHGQAGYMHADRFDISKKKLAKGVGSIHARFLQFPQPYFRLKASLHKALKIVQVRLHIGHVSRLRFRLTTTPNEELQDGDLFNDKQVSCRCCGACDVGSSARVPHTARGDRATVPSAGCPSTRSTEPDR
jgi:hypothetical protein